MVRRSHLLPLLTFLWATAPLAAEALPVPDSTLGTQVNLFAPDAVVVSGGTDVGDNRFYSFDSFGVATGESVYFFSPANTENVFGRVTGAEASIIDGVVGSFGSDASLFLINPNGVSFGPNASLDVLGSFVVTTADAIALGDTGIFSTAAPAADRLLSVTPSALLFNNTDSPNPITSQARGVRPSLATLGNPLRFGLQVPEGKALAIVGGPITLSGSQVTVPTGRVEIAAVAASGEVSFSASDGALTLPGDLNRADITLDSGTQIRTFGSDVFLTGNNIELNDLSGIFTGLPAGFSSPGDGVGDIHLAATGNVSLSGSFVSSALTGTGQSGSIEIAADVVDIVGSQVNSSTAGAGNAGDVNIVARQQASFDGSAVFSGVAVGAAGAGGNIEIETGRLDLVNSSLVASTDGTGSGGSVLLESRDLIRFDRSSAFSGVGANGQSSGGSIGIVADTLELVDSQLVASTVGRGSAGGVTVGVSGQVRLDNSQLFTGSGSGSSGSGGDIDIRADSLYLINGAALVASTDGGGSAGQVILQAGNLVRLDRSFAFTGVGRGGAGVGGDINIRTDVLEVVNGAQLVASSDGAQGAGNVAIRARDRVRFENSVVFSSVGGTGVGGDINITTDSLELDGAQLIASTFGVREAGNVRIQATDRVRLTGSAIFSGASIGSTGAGGDVDIDTGVLEIRELSSLVASSDGAGDAGNVTVRARERVNLQGFGSAIFSGIGGQGSGSGGSIQIDTPVLEVLDGAQLVASTDGTGDAGSVIITARDRARFDSSVVFGSANLGSTGAGGSIEIETGSLEVVNGAQLTASTLGDGDAGNIIITADSAVVDGSVIQVISLTDSRAGNLEITADSLRLDNGGRLSAETATVDGGNILLTLDRLLLLRNGSQITATAGTAQAGGNGGNVTITAPFVVAIPKENSDITANAFAGSGGQVTIVADGVFGIEPRLQLTPLSDITASSELGLTGEINFEVPGNTFLENDLSELPDGLVNPEVLLATSCVVRQETGGTFVVTGSTLPEAATGATSRYTTGAVRDLADQPLKEPGGIYQTAGGRLVMSRECG